MRLRSSIAASIALLLLAACGPKSREKGERPPRDVYPYSVAFDDGNELPSVVGGIPLLVDGKEVGKIDRYVRFELPAATKLTSAKLAVRLDSTCGPVDVPIETTLSASTEERERKEEDTVSGRLKLQKPLELARVYLDHSSGKGAANVRLGKHQPKLEAGKTWKGKVLVGSCPEAKKVFVDDKEEGALSSTKDKATLVDAGGGQCYSSRLIMYSKEAPSFAPDPKSGAVALDGKRVYEVDELDYFLEKPPESKKTTDDIVVDRWLERVDCKKK